MPDSLKLSINGRSETIDGVRPSLTLLDHLRQRGLVGTKEGCAEGDCGACTVAVMEDADGASNGTRSYRSVNSCLVPVAALSGRSVVTVEAVAAGSGPDGLHPVQEALASRGGSQCGYCTPGFVMSLFAGYYSGETGDDAIEGNLCRCTGYGPIRAAARSLGAPAGDDPHLLALAAYEPSTTEPSYVARGERFDLPHSLEEALAILAEHPNARPISGATDLGVEMNKFGRRFPHLVSLERIPELRGIEITDDGVRIGGAESLSTIEARLHGVFPALDTMLALFAARQIRNRATIGGNLANASPIGDLPPVLMALEADVILRSSSGERVVPIDAFFVGYKRTALETGEVIRAVRIPRGLPAGGTRHCRSYKVGKRGTDDISTVAAAYRLDVDASGVVTGAILAYGGVAATPARAREVEAFLVVRAWNESTAREAAARLREAFEPLSDVRGSAGYRRALAGNLFLRFFEDTAALEAAA